MFVVRIPNVIIGTTYVVMRSCYGDLVRVRGEARTGYEASRAHGLQGGGFASDLVDVVARRCLMV